MAVNIKSDDDFSKILLEALQEYSHEIERSLNEEVDKIAKEISKDLKSDPVIPTRTGEYKKSFYIKKIAQGQGYKRVAVANRIYNLTHLLEKGHATKNKKGFVKDYPHWEGAEKKVQELYDTMLKRINNANK